MIRGAQRTLSCLMVGLRWMLLSLPERSTLDTDTRGRRVMMKRSKEGACLSERRDLFAQPLELTACSPEPSFKKTYAAPA